MRIFFFDTETTGLLKNYNQPASKSDNWPRLVQLAWEIYEDEKQILTQEAIIKPEGFSIPLEASNIHGITTERAVRDGNDLKIQLALVNLYISNADLIVAHNISFDIGVLGSEFLRKDMSNPFKDKKVYCTKEAGTSLCKLPGKFGRYKWPSLNELYTCLFKKSFEGAHNAANDVAACRECYFEMKRIEK